MLRSIEQKGIMKQLWPSKILDQGTGFTLELFFPAGCRGQRMCSVDRVLEMAE
jgi:hypothetical protein